jgi:hypothetical protein
MKWVPNEPIPRIFGELLGEPSWLAMCQTTEQLDSVEIISFVADGESAQVQFKYRANVFSACQSDGKVKLLVEDGNCPDELLAAVCHHFAAYFSPRLLEY